MSLLPYEFYRQVEQTMPIACIDFVPVRQVGDGRQVGLISRESPYGRVWCHLGGRIRRGETIVQGLQRHARETVGVETDVAPNAQPVYVYEWFPSAVAPNDGTQFGNDERKHSIGLSYVVRLLGDPSPQGEALAFEWFETDRLPENSWPGSAELVRRLLGQVS
ncbi:DUF4916 domain-containing protein [Microbacterium thalli]|uniref:DUF4916 domain-containing protein n=1 Tax=Microbacterium thalli TaxID=3027921 RepID=UPI002365CC8C|nr:DUF4916 domain-containing protein [Microbacterium thalli]MDD7930668.1 DUF4916 domain-containing protein [Microbacterium thalli]